MPRPDRPRRRARGPAVPPALHAAAWPWTTALAALLAAGCAGGPDSPLPGSGPPPRNVLVTLIDTCAAGHLPSYGYDRPTTPFLAALAEESVVFTDATASASYTLASVASLFTGQAADRHRVGRPGDVLPRSLPAMAEAFDAAGFETLGVSTNAHIVADFGFDRGFDTFRYVPIDLRDERPMEVPAALLDGLSEFLADPGEAPFFLYLHLLPPHAPYTPPEPYPDTFAGYLPDTSLGRRLWQASGSVSVAGFTPTELDSLVDLYDSSLRYVDDVLADVHADLVQHGLLEQTLWVVVSDHGEAFGQHGALQHSSTVYQELVHVPLMLRFPGGEGRRIDAPVGLIDLLPTLGALFELDLPRLPEARSLVPLWSGAGGAGERSLFTTATPRNREYGLRRGRFKLVRDDDRERYLLFDLESDPTELEDVSAAHPGTFEALRRELDARVARWQAAGPNDGRRALAPEIEAQLRAIGYGEELDGDDAATPAGADG